MSLLLLLQRSALLGLTSHAQFGLGTTIYTSLVDIAPMPGAPQQITHVVPNSTSHPIKYLGRGPGSLQGVLQLTAATELAFLTALQSESKRRVCWLNWDNVEVYVYAYAGEITSRAPLHPYGAADSSRLMRVGFRFVLADQRLYKSLDDSVIWGS